MAAGKEQTGRKIQVHSLRSSARLPNRVGRNRKQRPNGQGGWSARDSGYAETEWQEATSKAVGTCQQSFKEEASFCKVRQVHQRSTIGSDKDLKW